MSTDPENQIGEFLALKEFVSDEGRATRRQREENLARSTSERVARGRCVSAIRFSRDLGNNSLRFTTGENLSEFREGDPVTFHLGDPFQTIASGVWLRDGLLDRGTEYIDCVIEGSSRDRILGSSGLLTIDPDFIDLSGILQRAIDEMGATERGRTRILPLLNRSTGVDTDAFDPQSYEKADRNAADQDFNTAQRDAVAMGASADWCCLIAGPPGTGKTRVLARIVRERLDQGQRILVTAGTHRAIHEALNRIARTIPDCDRIAKIGLPQSTPELHLPQFDTFDETRFALSDQPYVIGATPYSAYGKRLSGAEFDCVIIDEAGQIPVTLGIPAMLQADRYVILGDPRQLPPVVVSKPPSEASAYSLFSRLARSCPTEELNVTWRLNRPICNWISDTFYKGLLRPAEPVAGRTLNPVASPSAPWLGAVLDPTASLVWISCRDRPTRKHSVEEADLSHQIVNELRRCGIPPSSIAILTPFRRQARLIRRRFRENTDWEPIDADQLIVDTVERMQGQEREVILISTAAADPGFIDAIREFLYLPARLNVMVSRAQVKVIVLASDAFLTPPETDDHTTEGLADWKSLRDASTVIEV